MHSANSNCILIDMDTTTFEPVDEQVQHGIREKQCEGGLLKLGQSAGV